MEDIKNTETKQVVSTQKGTLTLLGHIERIIELSEKSKLSDRFYEKAGEHIDAVCKILHLNAIQAILFSHLVDRSNDNSIYMSEIAEKLKIRTVRLIQYQDDIGELERRRMVRCCRDNRSITYRVHYDVLEALRQNREYQHVARKDITIDDFFDYLDRLFDELGDKELTYPLFVNETDALCEDNPQLQFTQQLKKIDLSSENRVLLLRFCNLFVENKDDNIRFH
ncbi:MAG: hypothetical protein LBC47_07600, partial [Tannerella sp.]|nr:hypothetical protein [Tannerella sp.]